MTTPNPTPEPGATPPTGAPPADPAKTDPPKDPDALGEGGKAALAAERAARKELEVQLKAQAAQLAGLEPLKALAAAIGVKPDQGKTDVQTLTEQVTAMQQRQQDAELRAIRLEVAAEKGLTPAQAARLSGSTREELATDADALKALFPATTAPGTPGTPRPDPSQGPRGSIDQLQAAMAEAVKNKNVPEQIRLKTLLHAQQQQ